MAVNSVTEPFFGFADTTGQPLEGGYIYIGQPGLEARSNPKASFFDVGLTIPTGTANGAAVRTAGGYPLNNGSAAIIYVDGDFSTVVTDRNGVLIFSRLNRAIQVGIESTATGLFGDGNLAGAGVGFSAEPDTGMIRSAAGQTQDIVLGTPIIQKATTGVDVLVPMRGLGVQRLRDTNRITNGAFDLWQRGISFPADGMGADRWRNGANGGTVTQSRQGFALGDTIANNNPNFYLRQTVSGQTLPAHVAITRQYMEFVRTYAGQTITVMGWIRRSSGTGNVWLDTEQYFGSGGSPSANVIAGGQLLTLTGTFTPFACVVNVPSIAGKTLGTNSNDWFGINFFTSAGSNFDARTSSLGIQTIGMDIWGIHIKIGVFTVADVLDYIAPPLDEELAKAQRFYEVVNAVSASNGAFINGWNYAVPKRTVPTINVVAGGLNGGTFEVRGATGISQATNSAGATAVAFGCDAELV
jgi:hypothetical protein